MVTNSWTGNTVPPVGDANEMLSDQRAPSGMSALSLAGRWTPAGSSREYEGGRLPKVLNGADRSNGLSSVRGVGEAPCFGIVHRGDQGVDVLLHRLGDVLLCSVQAGEERHRILAVSYTHLRAHETDSY